MNLGGNGFTQRDTESRFQFINPIILYVLNVNGRVRLSLPTLFIIKSRMQGIGKSSGTNPTGLEFVKNTMRQSTARNGGRRGGNGE
jgi:hypothetical protein